MKGVCKVFVVGRVGQAPELRTSKAGKAWTRFSVATSRNQREGEEWVEETDWYNVVVFGDEAERAYRDISPGDPISVEGDMQIERWEGEDGQKRVTPRIVARRLTYLSAGRQREQVRAQVALAQAAA